MPTCRVLIVDDQRDVRKVLRAALETLNHEVQITDVPSGEEAILVISHQPVEVLIADVRLPGISGLELIQRARVRNPNLRLVLITGMTDDKVRRQVEAAQADAFFYKPIDIRLFLDAMQNLLGFAQPGILESAAVLENESPEISPSARFLKIRTAALREELHAEVAALVNASGEHLAQDGSLTLATGWTAALAAARRSVGVPSSSVNVVAYLSDGAFDFLVVSVDERLWLAAGAVHRAWDNVPFGRLVDILRSAVEDFRSPEAASERTDHPDISLATVTSPTSLHLAVPGEAAVPDEDRLDQPEALENTDRSSDLDSLLEILRDQDLKSADADAFWDTAAKDHANINLRPNGLTFDQARQMGLAPDED